MVNSACRPESADAGIAGRWPGSDASEDADVSKLLAAVTQFYLSVGPEPAALSAACGLAVVARSALGHVRDTYLTPWSAGDVRHKLMAVTVLSAMAEDQLLAAAALDLATDWVRRGGQEQAVAAAIALGGSLGQRHPGEAMRRLWVLAMRDERVSQVARLAFGQLFAVETATRADKSAVAGFLVHKVRQLEKSQATAHERRAALAVVNAVLGAARADSATPAVASLIMTSQADLRPVAELWAAALSSVPHRRTALIALHLTLAALTDDTDSVERAVSLGQAILPRLTARTREVLDLTLPDPQRTEAISARLIAAFLGAKGDVVGASRLLPRLLRADVALTETAKQDHTMNRHHLEPSPSTTVDVFGRDLPPVLTVEPGDTVLLRSLDATGHVERQRVPGETVPVMISERRGHCLTGPIAVRGAMPGDVLAIRFVSLRPDDWGWTVAGARDTALARRLGLREYPPAWLLWQIDADAGVATDNHGHQVTIAPFHGVAGLAWDEPGEHSTVPPRAVGGGNIDCKELVAGSVLYLPVTLPGALLSIGDGHAAQGDGEVAGTAIECGMTTEVQLDIVTGRPVPGVHAETPAGWITFGFSADLNTAMYDALDAMLGWMEPVYGLGKTETLALASPVLDLRVTQVANESWGVHALLPAGAIR